MQRCYDASVTWFDFWDVRAAEAHAKRCAGFTGRLDAGDIIRRAAMDRLFESQPEDDEPLRFSTTVVHVRREKFDVYIGRANKRYAQATSKWANPYRVGRDGDRATVIARYREYVLGRPDLLEDLGELRRKRLGCWCKPADGFGGRLMCHGQILAGLADDRPPEDVL